MIGTIGDLNPLVFPFLCANGFAWCIYSVAKRDPYVFAGNILNTMLGLFYCTTVIGLTESSRARARLECLLICLLFTEGIFAFIVTMLAPEAVDDKSSSALGFMGLVMVMLLFASPLSSMASVARTKDSSSINKPFCVVQFANCAVWLAYGVMVGDNFIAAPNGFGLATAGLQGLLIVLFPQRTDALDPLPCDERVEGGKMWDERSSGRTEPPKPHTPREALPSGPHGRRPRDGCFRGGENLYMSAEPGALPGTAAHLSENRAESSWQRGRAQGLPHEEGSQVHRALLTHDPAQSRNFSSAQLSKDGSTSTQCSTLQVSIAPGGKDGNVSMWPERSRDGRWMAVERRAVSARCCVLTWSEAREVFGGGDSEDERERVGGRERGCETEALLQIEPERNFV